MLRPELQDLDLFAAGVEAIVDTQRRVALNYFEDGSVDAACPPLKALLHIMAHGHFLGKGAGDAGIRRMFDRDALLASAWYRERLQVKQARDIALWRRHIAALEQFRSTGARLPSDPNELHRRLAFAQTQMSRVSAAAYREELTGTIGADPFYRQMPES
jgi:hypothetical protein